MTEFNPRVSIVIPVYNGANYLREAIDSALAQTYKDIEVVVINDGSTDAGKTEEIALSYGDKIRYFRKENGGVASALNLGIREMTGEYFSWLSHDDVYYPNKVETEIEWLRCHQDKREVILYSDYDVIDGASHVTGTVKVGGVNPHQFCFALIMSYPLHGCDTLVPKSCFAEVGTFDEKKRTSNDYNMWYRLAKKYNFIHISRPLIQGRDHPNRGSYTLTQIQKKEVNELFVWMLDELSLQEIEEYARFGPGPFYVDCAIAFIEKDSVIAALYALKRAFPYAVSLQVSSMVRFLNRFVYFLCFAAMKLTYRVMRRLVGKYRRFA